MIAFYRFIIVDCAVSTGVDIDTLNKTLESDGYDKIQVESKSSRE